MRQDTIGARLGKARRTIGNSLAEFSKIADIPESTLKKYESGHRVPGGEAIQAIARAGVNAHWLLTGNGPILVHEDQGAYAVLERPTVPDGIRERPEDYSLVPLYDVSASAGHGALVEAEQVIDYLAFKREWLRSELHATEGDLYLIEVDGESMEPTLRPGDIILIDRRNAGSIPRDGVYVLRLDGSLLVKRLQRMPGQAVRVTSDNAAYEPFSLALDAVADDLEIVGRVVWSGRRM